MAKNVDVLVVGGGINGVGIARDAAGRGLTVALCEQDDLAAHTSSASTKLIHGGLRYLEQYEFALVAKALSERKVLLRLAPHISRPLMFVLPHESHLRPVWMIRLGLMLYDRLGAGHKTLQDSRSIDLTRHEVGKGLQERLKRGFVYSDGWVHDSRLVVLNAMDAHERGAAVYTRTRCENAYRDGDVWRVALRRGGHGFTLKARALINATGPWAAAFTTDVLNMTSPQPLRLVKGSHIVVPRLFDHAYAYLFQQPDKRIVFAIPYEHDYTLIGTTDVDVGDDPGDVQISDDEVHYLCDSVNRYFRKNVHAEDVIWSYSGTRPLAGGDDEDASEVTRDYRIHVDEVDTPALIHVFGGKLTTYRRLAEDVVDRLVEHLGVRASAWTAKGPVLPGGEFDTLDALVEDLLASRPWLQRKMAERYARSYGSLSRDLLGDATHLDALGECFGDDLYQAEVDYLIDHEWARSAEDVLWRRSKLGLRVRDEDAQRLQTYIGSRVDKDGRLLKARAI